MNFTVISRLTKFPSVPRLLTHRTRPVTPNAHYAVGRILNYRIGLRGISTDKESCSPRTWWSKLPSMMQGGRAWSSTNLILSRLAQLGAGGALIIPSLDIVYTYISNVLRENELARAFHQGSVHDISLEHFIERPGISTQIARLLTPRIGYNAYHMIVGYHGTGKTTLVRHLSHQFPGIIYIDVLPNQTSEEAFAKAFARAIRWTPPRRSWFATLLDKFDISATDPIGSDSLYDTIWEEFGRQAAAYKRGNDGRCAVLVIDNVNRLAVRNPLLLEYLQDTAKDAADDRRFVTIFVTSEGHAPLQLLGRSAISRLGTTLPIRDINKEEVVTLLCDKRGQSPEVAEKIYYLVGGRIKLIEEIMRELGDGKVWSDIRFDILQQAKNSFKRARLEEGSLFPTVGLKIADIILEKGHINSDEFFEIAGSWNQYTKLLSCNIFATIPLSDLITFQSKPVEHVARELLGKGEIERSTTK